MEDVIFILLLLLYPLGCLFFFWFGAYWYGKKERLTEEMRRGAYEAGAEWLREWKKTGLPEKWPGNNPPPYYEERYWQRFGD